MRGRSTAFIFKSMFPANQRRFFSSYDPLQGFEPWNPQSPTSPMNPANPIYQQMMYPEDYSSSSKKKKSSPAPTPATDEKQPIDLPKLRADY